MSCYATNSPSRFAGCYATHDPTLAQSVAAPPPPQGRTPEPPAGHATRKRRAHRYEVEIDGEVFEVRSAAEAMELLAKAREMAHVTAARAVAKTAARQEVAEAEPDELAAPVIKLRREQSIASDYLLQRIQAQVEATQAAVAEIYAQAQQEAAAKRAQMLQDDEDAITALLMGL